MFRLASLAALLLVFAPFSFAQVSSVRLLNVSPVGAKLGTTVEVMVSGTDLDELKHLHFSHSGISAVSKPTNRFEVTVAKNVPPGLHGVHAVGKFGASNPRVFAVGVLDEVTEEKNSGESPQTVALESTINGHTDANTIDYFRFSAKRGQRILVRCETRAIDSRLEPVLALYDGTGREVNRARGGGQMDFLVPDDGEFTIRLHDVTYRGGADYFYRLSLGAFPHVDYIVPIASNIGGTTTFAIYGRNFSDVQDVRVRTALDRIEVELAETNAALSPPLTTMPAQAGIDLFEYRFRNARGVSDGALIRFPMAPVVAEEEPNNAAAAARKITPPCEVAGQFFPNGDRDWFTFEARKGDVYWIEVISHRLGLPTDPFVLVQRGGTNSSTDVLELNDSEANVGGAEFNTTHRDPSGRFEAKEDGTYRLQVRDLFSQPQRNAALVYQLIIRKPSPDFRLVALPATPLPVKKDGKDIVVTTTSLRREEVLPIKVIAMRRDGFDGAIHLSVKGLDKAIAAAPGRIEAGKNSALMFLRAGDDCTPSVAALKIHGTSSLSETNITREAKPVSLIWNVPDPATEGVQSHVGREYVVSTLEDVCPVRLTATEEKTWEVVTGSKLKIPLTVKSDGELTGNPKLKAMGVAGLESAKEFDLDPKSTNAVYEIDLGQQKLAPGIYTFALQGLTTVKPKKAGPEEKKPAAKESTFTLYSSPITFKVNPAPTNSAAK